MLYRERVCGGNEKPIRLPLPTALRPRRDRVGLPRSPGDIEPEPEAARINLTRRCERTAGERGSRSDRILRRGRDADNDFVSACRTSSSIGR